MKISDFERLSGAKLLTGDYEDREIASGYTCDLLSHVMGHGQPDMAWITVQSHMNVIAVAALLDFACVIIPENLPVEAQIAEKAQEEGIVMFSSDKTAYELVVLLAQNGVAAAKK